MESVVKRRNFAHKAVTAMLLLVFVALTACGNDDIAARTMSVFRVDGNSVVMTRGTRQETAAHAGARLSEGYAILTGGNSFCYIQLDTTSLVKMDEHSQISVNRLSDRLLILAVDNGQVLIDVQNQDPEHTLETRIGNVAIGVRGTLFIAGHDNSGGAYVIMFEGVVDVNGTSLTAGNIMHIYDVTAPESEIKYYMRALELADLDDFALQATINYQERVIGLFTPQVDVPQNEDSEPNIDDGGEYIRTITPPCVAHIPLTYESIALENRFIDYINAALQAVGMQPLATESLHTYHSRQHAYWHVGDRQVPPLYFTEFETRHFTNIAFAGSVHYNPQYWTLIAHHTIDWVVQEVISHNEEHPGKPATHIAVGVAPTGERSDISIFVRRHEG